jgi:hypothetical protein
MFKIQCSYETKMIQKFMLIPDLQPFILKIRHTIIEIVESNHSILIEC